MPRVSDDQEWRRQYHLDRYHRIRAKIIDHMGGKCVACDATEGLEIHHRDPKQKSFEISTGWGRPWSEIDAELKKCELRCGKHHKNAHEAKHGTPSRYRAWKCRCRPCVEANYEVMKVYKATYLRKKRDAAGPVTNGSFEVL